MIAMFEKDVHSTAATPPRRMYSTIFSTGKALIVRMARTRIERDQLANLSVDQLRDIGVSEEDAMSESRRSLMDLPAHRW